MGSGPSPIGSTLALQQLLAQLGYLPVNFNPASGANDIASTPAAEETAIVNPPQGTFSWRYPNTPAQLKALWSPTNYTELTKGAVMAFEDAQGLPTDGVAGPDVWKALINAAVKDQKSTFGYTFVMVSEASPETEHVWHNGKIVVHGLVNTGIAAAPTALGTYAVYEHIPVGHDERQEPGRVGLPRSRHPVISATSTAVMRCTASSAPPTASRRASAVSRCRSPRPAAVYPYTPIGTIVNLTG